MRAMNYLVSLAFAGIALPSCAFAACSTAIPNGASQLGYTTNAFNLCPTLASLSFVQTTPKPLYNGVFWVPASEEPSPTLYSTVNNMLAIKYGGSVSSTPTTMASGIGQLPTLAANKGFYVEFTSSISDNNPDHWPAVWMLPVEHDLKQADVYGNDPPHFERWEEIDVDEGGFTTGEMPTAISWSGVSPNYQKTQSNYMKAPTIDRTQLHRFGVGFNPATMSLSYWFDGALTFTANPNSVSNVITQQHFYLIASAQSVGKKVPYTMYVAQMTAYIPK